MAIASVIAFRFASRAGAVAPRERRFQFEYKATVKEIPTGAKKVDLWIPVPHDTPFQKITDLEIESPYPYKIHTAEYGNKVLHISLNNPQQSSFTVTMRFNAARKEHIQERLQQASYSPCKEERDPTWRDGSSRIGSCRSTGRSSSGRRKW